MNMVHSYKQKLLTCQSSSVNSHMNVILLQWICENQWIEHLLTILCSVEVLHERLPINNHNSTATSDPNHCRWWLSPANCLYSRPICLKHSPQQLHLWRTRCFELISLHHFLSLAVHVWVSNKGSQTLNELLILRWRKLFSYDVGYSLSL